jgi:hypothetical protein
MYFRNEAQLHASSRIFVALLLDLLEGHPLIMIIDTCPKPFMIGNSLCLPLESFEEGVYSLKRKNL